MRIPPLRSFLSLPVTERRILIRAFFLVSVIRMGMWLLPFRTLQKILGKLFPSPVFATGQPLSPEKLLAAKKNAWAVQVVSRFVPSATCLTQALTLQALISREGIPSNLAIGVARGDKSGIAAHAWLEVDGTAIIGGEERDRFTRLKTQE